MRYFKYQNYEHMEDPSLRERFALLLKKEKRLKARRKWLSRLGNIVFVLVWALLFGGCIILISLLFPPSDSIFEKILNAILSGALAIFAGVITALPAILAAIPFWNKKSTSLKTKKQELLSMLCANLRDFYGLQEPHIVTKCYDASDKRFKNHDICLFVVGDELRLTTNLLNGFFHREKDLGCYAFCREEIFLSQGTEPSRTVELKAAGNSFLLAARARPFLEKHFLTQQPCPIPSCQSNGE